MYIKNLKIFTSFYMKRSQQQNDLSILRFSMHINKEKNFKSTFSVHRFLSSIRPYINHRGKVRTEILSFSHLRRTLIYILVTLTNIYYDSFCIWGMNNHNILHVHTVNIRIRMVSYLPRGVHTTQVTFVRATHLTLDCGR